MRGVSADSSRRLGGAVPLRLAAFYPRVRRGTRREHEFEYIQKRIGILDFVLSHPECQYLETEPEKVSYFCNQLRVVSDHVKTYFLEPANIP